jgi:hypothetical protein
MKTTTQNYDVKMNEQCRPEGHIKITLVSGSTTYYFLDSQIQSATRLSDIDPLSRRVPKETFTFSIFDYSGEYNPSNPSGKWSSMDENAEISVQFGLETTSGNTEWLATDTYTLDAKPTVSGGIATFKASSKLCHLTKTYYKGTYGSTDLRTLAIAVLTDAGISSYSIDSTLSSMYTVAPLPVTTHLNCLQLIAHAARCTLRSVNGLITIAPFNFSVTPSEYIIGLDSIALNGDAISKIETLYKVDANLYSYSVDSTDSELYSLTVSDTDTISYHVEYDLSSDQTVSISGDGTLSNIHTYARCADFTVTGTGSYTVTIVGKKITTTTSTFESIIGTDANGSTDSEKNELITNSDMLSSLVYQVSNYLQYRLTHTVRYRGNPEIEPLDAFYFATTFGTYITALCLTHTISYNGAFSGSLTLKSISELSSVYLLDNTSTIVVDSDGENVGIIGTSNYTSSYSESDMDDFIEEVNGS